MKMLRCKTIASSLVVCPIFMSLKTTTCRAFTALPTIHHNGFSGLDRSITPPNHNNKLKHGNKYCSDTSTKRFFGGTIDDTTNDIASSSSRSEGDRSVTGSIYSSSSEENPIVTLYTKEGCTLCDKVSDVSYIQTFEK